MTPLRRRLVNQLTCRPLRRRRKRAELVRAATGLLHEQGLPPHHPRPRRRASERAARQRLLLLQDQGRAGRGGHRVARGGPPRAVRRVVGAHAKIPGFAFAASFAHRSTPPIRSSSSGARTAAYARSWRSSAPTRRWPRPARASWPCTSIGPSEQFRALGARGGSRARCAADLVAAVQGTMLLAHTMRSAISSRSSSVASSAGSTSFHRHAGSEAIMKREFRFTALPVALSLSALAVWLRLLQDRRRCRAGHEHAGPARRGDPARERARVRPRPRRPRCRSSSSPRRRLRSASACLPGHRHRRGPEGARRARRDLDGKDVTLSAAYAKGPILLVFYRGGWCPFCNGRSTPLTTAYPEFQKRGITPVAVSVDTPESESKTKALYTIPFPVLSDSDAAVIQAFHVVKKVEGEELEKMKGFGVDLREVLGESPPRDRDPLALPDRQDRHRPLGPLRRRLQGAAVDRADPCGDRRRPPRLRHTVRVGLSARSAWPARARRRGAEPRRAP